MTRGRKPSSPDGVRRGERLSVWLTPGELAEIVAVAGDQPTVWARGILLRQARRQADGLDTDVDVAPVEDPIRKTEREVLVELARKPRLTDGEIAEKLRLGPDVVTRIRRSHRISPATTTRRKSGWEAKIRAAFDRGLSDAEIAAECGYSVATVVEYRHRLRLTRVLPREP